MVVEMQRLNRLKEKTRMNANAEKLSAHGAAGEAIELPISHGATTGYSWKLDLPEGVQRIDDGPQKGDNPSIPGAPSGGAIRVKARKGEHRIHARLMRPWQPDQPARVVEIALTVE